MDGKGSTEKYTISTGIATGTSGAQDIVTGPED